MAYLRVFGPFGPDRVDIGPAIVASLYANAHRGDKGRPAKIQDFLPSFGGDTESAPVSEAELRQKADAAMKVWATASKR